MNVNNQNPFIKLEENEIGFWELMAKQKLTLNDIIKNKTNMDTHG